MPVQISCEFNCTVYERPSSTVSMPQTTPRHNLIFSFLNFAVLHRKSSMMSFSQSYTLNNR